MSVKIVGVDNVAAAIRKLQDCDETLNVIQADARNLPFETGRFASVLCFGVYHSLEDDIPAAVKETFRVLKPGGRLCAEFRADTLHNRLIDQYKQGRRPAVAFHKWNYLRHEACNLLVSAGFVIEQVLPAINMPLLYHVAALRHPSQRDSDEHVSISVQKFPVDQAGFGCFLRCLKRKDSFPVSRMSQWWVMRSSKAVVILASPKTPTHSPKDRLVVTMSEVFS